MYTFYNTQHSTEKAILLCAVWVFLYSDILFIPTIIILRHVCHADAEMKHNETKYEHTCKVWVVAQKQQFELTISHTALHEHQTHIHSHVHMLFVYCTHHTNTHTLECYRIMRGRLYCNCINIDKYCILLLCNVYIVHKLCVNKKIFKSISSLSFYD